MKNAIPTIATLSLALAFAAAPPALDAQSCWSRAENPADRPSPLDSAMATMGGDMVKVCYGAPSARGRTLVGGEAHPFGAPWRTGANEATSIHLSFAATVGGAELDAGSYSFYTVPGEDGWEVHFNSVVERWGIPINDGVTANNVSSGTGMASAGEHTERMTFSFEDASADAATLVLRWEGYQVSFAVARR